jgi:maintenance of mitochondrial morphology protein 1
MGSNYILTLQPTFTQGLILGQLSVLVLLGLILRYLFLDASQFPTSSYRLTVEKDTPLLPQDILNDPITRGKADWSPESTEWFNVLLRHVRAFSLSC